MQPKVARPLVDVDELDQLGVQVWVAEGTIGHERVVEVLRVVGVAFKGVKFIERLLWS